MSNESTQIPAECDVLVVGGGPAGSTVATFLARKGWSVVQLERERHPRFHIGESLLPMNMPILERLGVLDRVHTIGQLKPGADFEMRNKESGYGTFTFDRTLNPVWPHAYHVKREEFDELLFRHAGANGVRTFERTKVDSVDLDDDGASVRGTREDGSTFALRARYFVDASGRDTLLGAKLGLKKRNPRHQSAALFAHFSGVERRPGGDEGNISVYQFEHGWVWMIPLRDGTVSVGAVCWPDYLKKRQGRNAEFLIETIQRMPAAWARMRNAVMVGNLHVTGNFSYTCTRTTGRRWIMVGDAYAFVDPIFSSGVFLGMHSGELAANVIDASLRDPRREASLQRAYRREMDGGIATFSWFIYRFTTPALRWLFANPRNTWRVEEAVISMLSGDVFRDGGVRKRLRMFKVMYYVTALALLPRNLAHWWRVRRTRTETFSGGTTTQDHA